MQARGPAFFLKRKVIDYFDRLLAQLMDLIEKGHVKPISPIKVFPFEDVPSAFRYMRGANHIGKIVISNGPNSDVQAPVSQNCPRS